MTESPSAPVASGSDAGNSDVVDISVPMRTEFIATLRMMAASIAADAGFSIDEIDDLRLAISEVVSSLTDLQPAAAGDDRIDVSFVVAPSRVSVTITTRHGDVAIELDDLASSILRSVVDVVVIDGATVTLGKRASEATGVHGAGVEGAAPDA
jgi:hypothetical protein